MEDVSGQISLYHNLFLICLVLFIVCLILSVILFFVLHISDVLGYLTGRRAKKQIQQLEEDSAVSGKLSKRQRANMIYADPKMQEDMGMAGNASPGARRVNNAVTESASSRRLSVNNITEKMQDNSVMQETSLLKQKTDISAEFHVEREIILIHTEEVI